MSFPGIWSKPLPEAGRISRAKVRANTRYHRAGGKKPRYLPAAAKRKPLQR